MKSGAAFPVSADEWVVLNRCELGQLVCDRPQREQSN